MIRILGEKNTVFNNFMSEIRDAKIQKDRMRFRRNLERMGEIFSYEISKELEYENKKITTPLGIAEVPVLSSKIILATILRAGLPLHQGFLNVFDNAGSAFISAYRELNEDKTVKINIDYSSSPDLNNKLLILADPMLATGKSMVRAYYELLKKGKPSHTHIVAVIASKKGVEYLRENIKDKNVTLWLGFVDDVLNEKYYIVPGLGDAGDLAYGTKL